MAKLAPDQQVSYIFSLYRKRHYVNILAYAKKEGRQEGERKKAIETALKLKKMDLTIVKIADATGLSIEEIEKL